jgi:hypothetical protein
MDSLVSSTVPDFIAQKIFGEDQLCFNELFDVKHGVISNHICSLIVLLFLYYAV